MIANVLIAALGILLVAGALSFGRMRALRRTRAMRALAGRMGWSFHAAPALDIVPGRTRLGLFSVRMHPRIRNHLSGSVGEYRIAVFDVEYSTPDEGGAAGWMQTVVHVQSTRLRLPAFSLRPERVFHRTGDRVGGGDIDFAEDPEFSREYQLRGRDEDAVRGTFGADVRAAVHRRPGRSVDADGGHLFVWTRAELVPPADLAVRVQAAVDLAAVLRGSADFQLAGRVYGNHGSRPEHGARIAARRRKDGFYDLF